MKKKFLVGAAVGTAGLMALTGAAMAQSTDGDGTTTGNSMWDRVAEILGVDPTDLENAVQQARSEERDAKLSERLTDAVSDGTITQEDADSISSWFASRPAFLDEIGGIGLDGGFCLRLSGDSTQYENMLQRLIDAGKITEDQAQQFRDWLAARPSDALDKLLPDVGVGMGGGPQGFGGRIFGRGPGGGLFEGRFHIMPYNPGGNNGGDSGESSSSTATGVTAGVGV